MYQINVQCNKYYEEADLEKTQTWAKCIISYREKIQDYKNVHITELT